jgi:transglutaminase-like putative cysteine protease
MRLAIRHLVTCRLEAPATGTAQTLRMEPRGLAGQFVEDWRLDVSADCLMKPVIDPYGNITYTFALTGPLETITFEANGIVSTEDTVGVVKGLSERLPHSLYLRETELTKPTSAVRDLAADIAASGATTLDRMHALMQRLADTLAPAPAHVPAAPCPNRPVASAGAVLTAGTGDDTDLAHVFIATARSLAVPARFVTGYVLDVATDVAPAVAAWAEAWCEGIGWIGFDAPRRTCPTEAYVRLAGGPDLRDAQPLRLAAYGAEVSEVTSTVEVAERPEW